MKRPLLALAIAVAFGAAAPAPSGAQTNTPADFGMLQQLGGPGVDINTLLQQYGQQAGAPTGAQAREAQPVLEGPVAPVGATDAMGDYRAYAEKLLGDGGALTESRKQELAARAQELGLDPREAEKVAEEIAAQRRLLVAQLLPQTQALAEEGRLAEDDRRFLEMRARDLGLDQFASVGLVDAALERSRKLELYRSFIEAFFEDGLLDGEELRLLEQKRDTLALTEEEHETALLEVEEARDDPSVDILAKLREGAEVATDAEALPLYGRELFRAEADAFTPAPGLPPPDLYMIGPGDSFQVTLWGRMEAQYVLTVDAEGKVQFPQVGTISVTGLSYAEAKELLQRKAEAITGVSAAVAIAEIRPIRVFAVGEVAQPGAVTLNPLATVVNAVMAAGGPTDLGSLRRVLLRRAGRVVSEVDFYQFLQGGTAEGNVSLEAGDVVVIPRAEHVVAISGRVKRPARYELRKGEGLRALLGFVGGLAPDAFGGRVQVRRSQQNQVRVVLDVVLAELPGDFALADGDVIRVYPLKPRIANEVKLIGHAYQPGTYAYRDGMRVSELVGTLEALKPDVDLAYAVVLRETGPERSKTTLPFHLGRALDGTEPGENLALLPQDEVYVFSRFTFRPPLRAQATGQVREPGLYRIEAGTRVADLLRLAGGLTSTALLSRAEVLRYLPDHSRETLYVDLGAALAGDPTHNIALQDEDLLVAHSVWDETFDESVEVKGEVKRPGDIPLTRDMRVRDLVFKAGGLTKDAYRPVAHLYRTDRLSKEVTIHTFDLGRALAEDGAENLPLQDLDRVVIHSTYQFAPPQLVLVSGMVHRPGEYPYASNMRIRDLVLASGGVTEDAYLMEGELVRNEVLGGEVAQTRTIRFSLAQALAGDETMNLALKPYDKLLVKRIPDWKETRSVQILGEVVFPGAYFMSKDEKLSTVLRRAGGYTSKAHLRGAVFTRESARNTQEQRLKDLRERLERTILRITAAEGRTTTNPEDIVAEKEYLAAQQALVAKLASVKATGRVVVKMLPLADLEDSDWDIVLEDGDALTIPATPQTVAVVGEVYNPTSMLWEPDNKRVEHYLAKTGGPTADAEKSGVYLVLADGTVVSPESASGGNWWGGGVRGLDLYPGDTVLVPGKVYRFQLLRGIRDITQILFQLAVTAGVVVNLI